ncbi:MAG: hypothetical protein GFH25_541324n9 [Chloroflexi bacterium AL-N10]|nr:hypothetical protein [Chloroflexi bacterium AL-N10]
MLPRLLPIICVCTLFASFALISPTTAEQKTSGSCVQGLDPIRPGETASAVHDFRCFDTFAEVIAYLSDGQVYVADSIEPHELTEDIVDQIALASDRTVIGVQWELPGYVTDRPNGFDNFTRYTFQSDACNGYSYGRPSMESGWNNVIQSAQGSSGCNTFEHWDGTNWSGDRIFCASSCPDMGTVNDRTPQGGGLCSLLHRGGAAPWAG